MSFLLQANSPNYGSLYIVLKPFAERQSPELRDTAIMAILRKRWAEEVDDAMVTVYGAAPVSGLSRTRFSCATSVTTTITRLCRRAILLMIIWQ